MRSLSLSLVALLIVGSLAQAEDAAVSLKTEGKKVTVLFNGKLFAEYRGEGQSKPIIYPIIGPTGVNMVRNWPVADAAEGEAKDHPHHRSLWYTHGDVNGVDFWAEGAGRGQIVPVGKGKANVSLAVGKNAGSATIVQGHEWRKADGAVVLTDEQTIAFHLFENGDRAIDYQITLNASNGDVVFGDTKEGTMGIRTHPVLRVKGPVAKGKAINSEGVEGSAVWGKRAKWVDYWAPIEGSTVGVAIMDHPTNPRHPTHWHARDYGLIAANPFGINDFEKKGKGAGNMTIKSGEKTTFKYRFLFHKGDVKEAKIAEQFEAWAK